MLIGGFYREWSHDGIKSTKTQCEAMKMFCCQIEKAGSENKNIVVTGDANLCSKKWMDPEFTQSYLSDELRSTLALCGLEVMDLGNTYLADRLTSDGNVIESALDHIYLSSKLLSQATVNKLQTSSTDHVPIITKVDYRSIPKLKNLKKITSFKNKTTLNLVTASYSFTQFSTLAKINTTTAREPSIHHCTV